MVLRMRTPAALSAALVIAGTLAAAAQCPDVQQNGLALAYSNNDLRRAKAHPLLAGGNISLSACASVPGIGYVTERPDFTMMFHSNPGLRALEFRVVSECDSVLLVNGANGSWYFDDDGNGNLDARIRINRAAEGLYDVWVGSLSDACRAQLYIETFNSR